MIKRLFMVDFEKCIYTEIINRVASAESPLLKVRDDDLLRVFRSGIRLPGPPYWEPKSDSTGFGIQLPHADSGRIRINYRTRTYAWVIYSEQALWAILRGAATTRGHIGIGHLGSIEIVYDKLPWIDYERGDR